MLCLTKVSLPAYTELLVEKAAVYCDIQRPHLINVTPDL